jgi:hypothetical protein
MCWGRRSAKISWCHNMPDLIKRALLITALLLAAIAGSGAAWAQTVPSSIKPTPTFTFTPSISTSTQTTATKKPSNTGEIYRWTDSQGRVQYGADVPEDRKSTARKLDTRANIVSSRVPARIYPVPQPEPSETAPTAKKPSTEREKCETAWQQYNESQSCFAQYRQGTIAGSGKKAGSNLSPEAQENCKSLPEPAPCR